jgi:tetratricopeptide (TPR) repeat protein
MTIKPSRYAWLVVATLAWACLHLFSCAAKPKATEPTLGIHALDSLHQEVQHQDSVEANLYFYEEAYTAYSKQFPAVDKRSFMAIAKDKDQAFCLFQPDPGHYCADVGDKYNNLGLKESAKDAYEAGLLSEGANDGGLNVRLWSRLAQLLYENNDVTSAQSYLSKVLESDPKNPWAKKFKKDLAKPTPN